MFARTDRLLSTLQFLNPNLIDAFPPPPSAFSAAIDRHDGSAKWSSTNISPLKVLRVTNCTLILYYEY